MPILFMALLALLVFAVIGVLLCTAVVCETRQSDKAARGQTPVATHKPTA